MMLPKIALIVLIVFTVSAVVEYFRQKLFDVFERTARYKKFMAAVDRLPEKLSNCVIKALGKQEDNQSMN